MAHIRGTAGYNLGHQNPFGGPGSADAASDPSPLDAIREQTSKIEDWLDTMADPVKPYVQSRPLAIACGEASCCCYCCCCCCCCCNAPTNGALPGRPPKQGIFQGMH